MVTGFGFVAEDFLGDGVFYGALEGATHWTGTEAGIIANFDYLGYGSISQFNGDILIG